MYPPGAGVTKKGPTTPIAPFSMFGDPGSFTGAATTQANDYDTIMKQYRDLTGSLFNNPSGSGFSPINPGSIGGYNPIKSNPLNPENPITSRPIESGAPLRRPDPIGYTPIEAKTAKYEQSDDVTGSLGRLKELSDTGGYTPQGIQDIRERNVSPIRSIYASGKQGLERQRALSGGYSPNFNAVSASMARDLATKVGDITTKTNAGIAEDVARNRLSASGTYAGEAGNANAIKTAADQRNADIINEMSKYNTGMKTNIDEFNTSTGLGVDKYNQDTQRDTDRYNRDTQLGLDERNRDYLTNVNRDNRNTQIGLDTGNRAFQAGIDTGNRDARTAADQFNANNIFKGKEADIAKILESIRGQASLYGTTPALTSLFGNQVMQAGQMGQGQQDINNRRRAVIIGAGRGR